MLTGVIWCQVEANLILGAYALSTVLFTNLEPLLADSLNENSCYLGKNKTKHAVFNIIA